MGAHRAHRRGPRRAPSVNPVKRSDPTPSAPVVPVEAATTAQRSTAPGRRKAARHTGSRRRLFPGLPPLPIAVGVGLVIGGIVGYNSGLPPYGIPIGLAVTAAGGWLLHVSGNVLTAGGAGAGSTPT